LWPARVTTEDTFNNLFINHFFPIVTCNGFLLKPTITASVSIVAQQRLSAFLDSSSGKSFSQQCYLSCVVVCASYFSCTSYAIRNKTTHDRHPFICPPLPAARALKLHLLSSISVVNSSSNAFSHQQKTTLFFFSYIVSCSQPPHLLPVASSSHRRQQQGSTMSSNKLTSAQTPVSHFVNIIDLTSRSSYTTTNVFQQ